MDTEGEVLTFPGSEALAAIGWGVGFVMRASFWLIFGGAMVLYPILSYIHAVIEYSTLSAAWAPLLESSVPILSMGFILAVLGFAGCFLVAVPLVYIGLYTSLFSSACWRLIALLALGSFSVCLVAGPAVRQRDFGAEEVYQRAEPVREAIDRYREAKGEWPPSLDALVPEYLTEVPPLCPRAKYTAENEGMCGLRIPDGRSPVDEWFPLFGGD